MNQPQLTSVSAKSKKRCSIRKAALPASASVAEEPFFSMVDLWVDPAGPGADAAADVLGIDALPTTPSTVVDAPDTSVIWLGPQEWLAVSADRAGEQMEAALRAATAAHGVAAVDVSAQRTSLRLRGANARALLAKGCSLDLHPQAFGPGDAAQTMLGHAGVVLMPMSDRITPLLLLLWPKRAIQRAHRFPIGPETTLRLRLCDRQSVEFFIDEDPCTLTGSMTIRIAGLLDYVPVAGPGTSPNGG